MDFNFQKKRGVGYMLEFANDEDRDVFIKLKYDQVYTATLKKISARNLAFHRKYFSLLNLGFDYWQPKFMGLKAKKDKDHYRKWVIKQAGFYRTVLNVDGSVENIAESIAFNNMDEETFGRLYNNSIDVLMDTVLAGFPPEEQNNRFNEILSYV